MKKNVLIVGAGPMAVDHYKVCKALGAEIVVVGRNADSAAQFTEKTGQVCLAGGLDNYLKQHPVPEAAIVAVGMEALAAATTSLLEAGCSYLLVEKPAGMNAAEIAS